MIEIILHHQEHRNLTRLACQSAWEFLKDRLHTDKSLEEVIGNKLHFLKEARRELVEPTNCVNWKREKEEEMGKETKEELIILRWLETLKFCYFACELWCKDYSRLIFSLVHLYRAAKEYSREIRDHCIARIRGAAISRPVEFDDLLNGGAVSLIFEEIYQPTLNDGVAYESLAFSINVSKKLKDEEDDEKEGAKRKKLKKKAFERLGKKFNNFIASFHNTLTLIPSKC